MTTARPAARSTTPAPSHMGAFERYLTLWVALCIVAGIGLGTSFPALFRSIGGMEVAQMSAIVVPWATLLVSVLLYIVLPVVLAQASHGGEGCRAHSYPPCDPNVTP